MHKTAQVRSTLWSSDVKKLHPAVARSTFANQNAQNSPGSEHFMKFRCRKIARRCGEKHICKSKCAKNRRFGALFEVPMSKNCTPLWREVKTAVAQSTFNTSRPGYRSKIDQVLRLPHKVTLEFHQVLDPPQKVTLEFHQVLHRPRKVRLELHQVLHLPRKSTLELHQLYCAFQEKWFAKYSGCHQKWPLSHMKPHLQCGEQQDSRPTLLFFDSSILWLYYSFTLLFCAATPLCFYFPVTLVSLSRQSCSFLWLY